MNTTMPIFCLFFLIIFCTNRSTLITQSFGASTPPLADIDDTTDDRRRNPNLLMKLSVEENEELLLLMSDRLISEILLIESASNFAKSSNGSGCIPVEVNRLFLTLENMF